MAGKEKIRIGLDIGTFSIKYARVSLDKEAGPQLLGFGIRRLNGTSEQRIIEELGSIANEIPDKSVNISIAGPSVVVRYIMLPSMKAEELASSMQFEAEKYIPFNINEIMLDHQILEPNVSGKMRVLLAAAKKETIANRLRILQQAGLNINIIDVDSFALINAFCFNNPASDPSKVTALLNIGEHLSSIDIIRNNLSYFSRDFIIGGRDITKAIAQKLNVDIPSAQNLKHNPEDRSAEIIEIAKPVLANMADEIRLSLSYYENQFGSGIDNVNLSGGGATQKGLVEFFVENLGIGCSLWDPTKALNISPNISTDELDNLKNELPIAIGLALRE